MCGGNAKFHSVIQKERFERKEGILSRKEEGIQSVIVQQSGSLFRVCSDSLCVWGVLLFRFFIEILS